MLAWPLTVPEPSTLTIPQNAPLPATYWQALTAGRWPHEYWLATPEPTSDAIDGVAIHALAIPGARTIIDGLPDDWFPLAQDEAQVFAVDATGAIYYRDLEVDQQLCVGQSWDDFVAQLTWQAPVLTAPFSQQVLAHALLVSDVASLPPLLEILREQGDWALYTQWLTYLITTFPTVVQDEISFALDFLPLSALQKHNLEAL